MRRNETTAAIAVVAAFFMVLWASLGSAQRKVARPPCNAGAQVFVLEPELVADKVRELNEAGYCLERGNFTVIGSKVMIMVTTHDRTEEEGP